MDAEGELKPFGAWLHEHNRGRTHDELGEHLRALTQAVLHTGKAGKLTFTIELKPARSAAAVVVSDKIDVKIPTVDRPESIFFADNNGNLVRNDPRQGSLYTNEDIR